MAGHPRRWSKLRKAPLTGVKRIVGYAPKAVASIERSKKERKWKSRREEPKPYAARRTLK
jgi:hypothetical protein